MSDTPRRDQESSRIGLDAARELANIVHSKIRGSHKAAVSPIFGTNPYTTTTTGGFTFGTPTTTATTSFGATGTPLYTTQTQTTTPFTTTGLYSTGTTPVYPYTYTYPTGQGTTTTVFPTQTTTTTTGGSVTSTTLPTGTITIAPSSFDIGQTFDVSSVVKNNTGSSSIEIQLWYAQNGTRIETLGTKTVNIPPGMQQVVDITSSPTSAAGRPIPSPGQYTLQLTYIDSTNAIHVLDRQSITVNPAPVSIDKSKIDVSGIPDQSSQQLGTTTQQTVTVTNNNSAKIAFRISTVLDPSGSNNTLDTTDTKTVGANSSSQFTIAIPGSSPTVSSGDHEVCARLIDITSTS